VPYDKEEKRDSLPAADRLTALGSACLRRQVRNDGYKKEKEQRRKACLRQAGRSYIRKRITKKL